MPVLDADVVPTGTVKSGLISPTGYADTHSLHLVTNTPRNAASIYINDMVNKTHTVLDKSWTIETFVKPEAPKNGDADVYVMCLLNKSHGWCQHAFRRRTVVDGLDVRPVRMAPLRAQLRACRRQ